VHGDAQDRAPSEMAAILGVERTVMSKYVIGARRCHDVTQLPVGGGDGSSGGDVRAMLDLDPVTTAGGPTSREANQ
jgi:hypothetical protein